MKTIIALLSLILGNIAYAQQVDCYVTAVKSNCWTKYNVTIDISSLKTKSSEATISIPAGTAWSRTKFTCALGDVLSYSATYSPVFWESDKGKKFYSSQYWTLPEKLAEREKALSITICFPDEFTGTPIPPDATGKCKCDPSILPPINLNMEYNPDSAGNS